MSWGVATQNGVSVSLASIVSLSCGATEFSPASLFTSGVAGAWYDPSDINNYMAGLGSELVTNGDFSSGSTSGWSAAAGAVLSVVSGALRITNGTSYGQAQQTISGLTVGKSYKVSIEIIGRTAPDYVFRVSATGYNLAPLLYTSGAATDNKQVVIVATSSTFYISVEADSASAGTYVDVDNISVKELTGIANATLFQDSAGTTPVTAVEQPVGLMLDKSQGLVASTKGGQMTGVSGSGFDTPSATANQITGDIDIRVQASLVSWTPTTTVFCSRLTTGGSTADSYEFWINASGVLQLLTVSGTTNTNVASSAAVGFSAGTTNWVRVTWQQSTGYVNFYTSSDGVTWTQNGTANRAGTTAATNAGSRLLRIGARSEGSFPVNGTIYRAQIYNGINGTLAVDFNPTLYTSGATFTAATSEVWTITGSNARIVPNGNHASQATAASRPILRARYNLLTYSEQFDNAAWTKGNSTVTANQTTAPDGTTTADKILATAGYDRHAIYISGTTSSGTCTASVYAKYDNHAFFQIGGSSAGFYGNFNISTGVVGTGGGARYISHAITNVGSGWYRLSVTYTNSSDAVWLQLVSSASDTALPFWTAAGTESTFVWGADLRTGSSAGTYQRIAAATDYATAGFLPYLYFVTDDSFGTNSIDFTATDKMYFSAGVTKLGTSASILAELSALSASNNGSFYVGPNAAATNDYTIQLQGTSNCYYSATTFAAPITNVVSVQFNIAGAGIATEIVPQVNGVTPTLTPNGTTAGTGNFGNYPLYIGRRNNASLPFDGRIYQMVICGKTLSASELASTEAYVNSKTGAY